jgi:hypothetical protein
MTLTEALINAADLDFDAVLARFPDATQAEIDSAVAAAAQELRRQGQRSLCEADALAAHQAEGPA